jgi:cysteine-S-conjugate beta-lyase
MTSQTPESLSTQLIHHPYRSPEGFRSPAAAVHKASTVFFADVATLRARDWQNKSGYTYGLHGTPTTYQLEERIATLEHGQQCVLAPSGLSAVALVNQAFLSAGDEVLLPANVYGPNLALAQNELQRWGVGHQIYNPMLPGDLAAKINAKTRLVWVEAPGSVSLEFPNLPALLAICREAGMQREAEREIIVALDNTWGAGIAFNAFELAGGDGVDISVQALTKYPSGGGDVLMGSVVTRREDLHLAVKATHMRIGAGVAANDAELILRSLPSISMRYAAQDAATRQVAQWLAQQPQVARVVHPAFPGSPGHEHWKALCTSAVVPQGHAACLLSVVFHSKFDQNAVDQFCDRLRHFKIGFSWAGPVSLVVPYDMAVLRRHTGTAWLEGCLVRLSVGMEAPQDLIADLDQALRLL